MIRSKRPGKEPFDQLSLNVSGVREARLRPAYAAVYPDLEAGVWAPARALAEIVLERGLYQHGTDSAAPPRLLNPSHFDFRGGPDAAHDAHRSPERIGDTYPLPR